MSSFLFFVGILVSILLWIEKGKSHPVQTIALIKTRVHQLNDIYDYIIVGGGTSGLTVADRLTEDGTSKLSPLQSPHPHAHKIKIHTNPPLPKPESILIIEYGSLEPNPNILLPATGLTDFSTDMYNYTSIPQPGLNNQTAILRAGASVGDGSAVNSMFFDRGSKEDYDCWERLGNLGWGWNGLLRYFKKVSFGFLLKKYFVRVEWDVMG